MSPRMRASWARSKISVWGEGGASIVMSRVLLMETDAASGFPGSLSGIGGGNPRPVAARKRVAPAGVARAGLASDQLPGRKLVLHDRVAIERGLGKRAGIGQLSQVVIHDVAGPSVGRTAEDCVETGAASLPVRHEVVIAVACLLVACLVAPEEFALASTLRVQMLVVEPQGVSELVENQRRPVARKGSGVVEMRQVHRRLPGGGTGIRHAVGPDARPVAGRIERDA